MATGGGSRRRLLDGQHGDHAASWAMAQLVCAWLSALPFASVRREGQNCLQGTGHGVHAAWPARTAGSVRIATAGCPQTETAGNLRGGIAFAGSIARCSLVGR